MLAGLLKLAILSVSEDSEVKPVIEIFWLKLQPDGYELKTTSQKFLLRYQEKLHCTEHKFNPC